MLKMLSKLPRWNRPRLSRSQRLLRAVNGWESKLVPLDDQQLRTRSLALRYRAQIGEPVVKILPEAFALVREAARRTLKMRHFDVQILGGIALCQRSVAEMQTGEGKTLTATLPLYLHALAGQGAHLATVNDYLARRDAALMRPVFELLGLTVGVIESEMAMPERRQAYACDVTYGTAKEFGFDFLRDRLLLRHQAETDHDRIDRWLGIRSTPGGDRPVGRGLYFILVDEADSILIDDAGTPLIISSIPRDERQAAARYRFAAELVSQLQQTTHYTLKLRERQAELTPAGRQAVRQLTLPPELHGVGLPTLYQDFERALCVEHFYLRDRNYVVRDGEICIVDEFTGRIAEGRKWRDGIHQAVEAKERLDVTAAGGQAARITVQDFFLRYKHLAGMSGTVSTSAGELRRIYKLRTAVIPTNRPPIRKRLPTRVLASSAARWQAVVDETRTVHAQGRPVLIGTRSIDKSEELSRMLTAAGIEHQVLNAHQIAREAEIVALAGQRGRVTVSTNMAGRGTDVKLGPEVADLGGMHVICTELHDAARIDRQLIGRCGRQGDPGSYRQYLSLDDDILLQGFDAATVARLKSRDGARAQPLKLARLFQRAQRRVERQTFTRRQSLLWHERQQRKSYVQMGLDPHLDAAD